MANKILMLYFSRAGQNWISSSVRYTAVGNTEILAALCRKYLNNKVDCFKVNPLNPYPSSYRLCNERVKYEAETQAYVPFQLLNLTRKKFDSYSTVILCYPIYCSLMPSPLLDLLKYYDLKDKTVIPFVTYEKSGYGDSLTQLRHNFPNATLVYGKCIEGSKLFDLFVKLKGEVSDNTFDKVCALVNKADDRVGFLPELKGFLQDVCKDFLTKRDDLIDFSECLEETI